MRSHRIPSSDGELHVTVGGNGPPLVVLHGGPGLDHTYLRPWLDPLAERATLVYLDLTGNGRSSEPADWSTVDHERWCGDVDAVMKYFRFDRIVLFGHSYGGYIAQDYALTRAHRLRGLILCDTAPVVDYFDAVVEAVRARGTAEQLDILLTAFGAPYQGDADRMRRDYRALLPLYFHRPDPELMDRLIADVVFRPAAFNRGFFSCAPTFDARAGLSRLAIPMLLLGGRHDWIVPAEHGVERIAALVPAAELEIFEESGHFPFVEEPAAFLERVGDWLDRLAERSAESGYVPVET